jgi:molybdate transport system regulatory protein
MKISARNVFEGQVSALVPGAVNTEVHLTLPGGVELVAVVTQASVRELGLAVGTQAVAVIKAPWVVIDAGAGELRFSARNQLAGTVQSVRPGAINAEVAIALPGGTLVHAIVTQEAVAELGLAPGVPARALIKASHIILGVREG